MRYITLVVLLVVVGCGDSPTAPSTQPPPAANRAPSIGNATVTPPFGMADLQTFTLSASATDPDGDALVYTWDIEGSIATGAARSFTVPSPGGTYAVRLRVEDGKGGSADQSLTFTAGSLSGTWTGTFGGFPLRMVMSQQPGGTVTATWTVPGTNIAGDLDPAVSNRVEANGRARLRCKVRQGGGVDDFFLDGTLQTNGRTLTGAVTGSGFSGQPFTLTK